MPEVVRDHKEEASRTFADVIKRTRDLFPERAYRPQPPYGDINMGRHGTKANSDGVGTKSELAERLADFYNDPKYVETIAFDLAAMVVDDAVRDGLFVVGLNNIADVNSAADPEFVAALARGIEAACIKGRFPLLDGETAELGSRAPGWGKNHLNWNATAKTLVNHDKVIDGSKLRPGQWVVALRERSIRSNGLTAARGIIQNAYLQKNEQVATHREFVAKHLRSCAGLSDQQAEKIQNDPLFSSPLNDHVLPPWHQEYPQLTQKLLTPSTIYSPLMYEAQGGVDGDVRIPLVACANISGGGVQLKASRMLEKRNLGLHMGTPFDDPEGVRELLDLSQRYRFKKDGKLFTDRMACEQWNRGVGFICVTEYPGQAYELVKLAAEMGYEADIAGEITDKRAIEFRGHTWDY
jgi:phosphoribosylaminoimidazole (AIR) synthetase